MKKYVYNGTSYVPEIPEGELALWKVQNVLGAKNLLVFPYFKGTTTNNGVTWTVADDGSITANGQIESGGTYAFLELEKAGFILEPDSYRLTVASNVQKSNAHVEIRITNWNGRNFATLAKVTVGQEGKTFVITSEMAEAVKDSTNGTYFQVIAQVNDVEEVLSDVVIFPMICFASDPDNTWTPYAPSNKDLYDMVRALQSGTTATTNRGGDENSDS